MSTISDFFGNVGSKISGLFNSSGTASNAPASSSIPTPARKPSVPASYKSVSVPNVPTVAAKAPTTTSGGFSLGEVGSLLEKVGGIVQKGVETYYGAKSSIAQLKTAQKLEETKYEAVVTSAQNAPAPAQILLPDFRDWLNNPAEAASRVTPAALAGSGALQTGLSSLAYLAGGAALIYFVMKRA